METLEPGSLNQRDIDQTRGNIMLLPYLVSLAWHGCVYTQETG